MTLATSRESRKSDPSPSRLISSYLFTALLPVTPCFIPLCDIAIAQSSTAAHVPLTAKNAEASFGLVIEVEVTARVSPIEAYLPHVRYARISTAFVGIDFIPSPGVLDKYTGPGDSHPYSSNVIRYYGSGKGHYGQGDGEGPHDFECSSASRRQLSY